MPFPSTLDAFLAAGYSYLKWERCSVCGLDVEIWTTPGKRTIAMEPTHNDSPVVRHYEVCQPKEASNGRPMDTQDTARRIGNGGNASVSKLDAGPDRNLPRNGETVLSDGGRDAQGSGIKLYGVTDKNIIAVGWLAGTLKVQFRFGCYHYANVPEDVFTKIRNNPFPNNMFVKLVKNHPELYTCTKLEA